MSGCFLCPRECGALRNDNNTGYCGVENKVVAARAALHMWEEPCISGSEGSGTVFFSGCNLRCVYCQNHDIAIAKKGIAIDNDRLCDIFFELEQKGANNINLVTPTHYVPQIVCAIEKAKNRGLKIPFVYNTGNYEKLSTLKMLEGLIDVYLPDCKYYSDELAIEYSNAPGYFNNAVNGIEEMYRQVGKNEFDQRGIMSKGVIVRHLILPGSTKDSKNIIRELYDRFGDDIYISIMNQYTPMENVKNHPKLYRKITRREYDSVVDYAIELGIKNAFIQEEDVAKESFIPAFDNEGI